MTTRSQRRRPHERRVRGADATITLRGRTRASCEHTPRIVHLHYAPRCTRVWATAARSFTIGTNNERGDGPLAGDGSEVPYAAARVYQAGRRATTRNSGFSVVGVPSPYAPGSTLLIRSVSSPVTSISNRSSRGV